MTPRKIVYVVEEIAPEPGNKAGRTLKRVAGLALIENPLAGKVAEDLSRLFDIGAALGDRLMPRVAELLGSRATSYGKGALVGTMGETEHGHALIHPKLGKPMRAAIGGGEALIPATCKIAVPGARLDVPLGHKDNIWSFEHFDTITVGLDEAPRPDEIIVIMALADGTRPWPRIGKGRVV